MSDTDLIEKIRNKDYFGITEQKASDEELRVFLRDEGNRNFIEGTIRQITFGHKVRNPPINVGIPAEVEFLNFAGDKLTAGGLALFLQELYRYSSLGPLLAPTVGTLITVVNGVEVFNKFVNVLKHKEEVYLVSEYFKKRQKGKSAEEAYNLTLNNSDPYYPDYQFAMDLILRLTQAKEPSKTRAELKKTFWDYCEHVYQSWLLANSQAKRDNIKRYILWWIKTYAPASTPTPIPTSACDFSRPVPLRETTRYGIMGDDAFDTVVCGYLELKPEVIFSQEQISAYFVIVDFLHEGFIKSIEEEIQRGNTVNIKEGDDYLFSLGCFQDGEITSRAEMDDQTQEALLDSSPEKLVSIIMSFEERGGTGCGCCNLAEKIRLYE